MRFSRFRIKNFRSIVDTGWHEMASDNITGIIGQNESGKTSILEALNSFYNGIISEDILRSDLSLPEVSCTFSTTPEQFTSILTEKKVPEEIQHRIKESASITLVRAWNSDKSSYLSFGDEEIQSYYQNRKNRKASYENLALEEVRRSIDEARKMEASLNEAYHAVEDTRRELSNINVRLNKAIKLHDKNPGKQQKSELDKFSLESERLTKRLEKKNEQINGLSVKAAELNRIRQYSQLCLDTQEELKQIQEAWERSYKELSVMQSYFESLSTEKEIKGMQGRLDMANSRHLENEHKLENIRQKASFRLAVTHKILKGTDPEDAEDLIEKDLIKEKSYYSENELAFESFKLIPEFELFEDFSSLLPNRIDLEDIFHENSSAEGFKAAKNFLTVSGLDISFFDQKNSRILKQKIEKMNSEITLNFQDFWRQSLGKNNKIRIQFELEHYDYSQPDKMGKPFLEFWIRDEMERLYPKQRSRGVRWFLSFYLELKANAISERTRSRVFLIDEPGLSLHARAQEDVLAVFEDIKDDIQIIYTTHSPHLINLNKLYRLLAVQRAIEDDMKSETVIFDPKTLNEASTDTLSPIYTLMGTKLSDHQFVKKKNNVIVEDTPNYYYITTLFKLAGYQKEIYFLPATGVRNVPVLVNLLLGWKLDFFVLLDDDLAGNKTYRELRKHLFSDKDELAAEKLIRLTNFASMEDLFSTIDFKNFILLQRVGITESNSEYIEMNNLSRSKLVSNFVLNVQNNKVKLEDFDDETRENIMWLVNKVDGLLS